MAEHGDPRCGYDGTDSGEPCQNPVSEPDETCHLHPEPGEQSDEQGDEEPTKHLPDPGSCCEDQNLEPIRADWDGPPQGWNCRACSFSQNYCMEEIDSGHCHRKVSAAADRCHTHGEEPDQQGDQTDALPEPPERGCGCDSGEIQPRLRANSREPLGWACSQCDWVQYYCLEEIDSGHCHRKVGSPAGSCYMHDDEEGEVPEGHGAPEGNDNAVGNSGGEPGKSGPPGNVNAMKHGLHMTAERILETLDEQQREIFKHRFVEYREGTMNDSQAMALAAASVMREELVLDLFEDGFTRTTYTDDGKPYDQFKKDDFQALQGFFREIRLGLHYEGNSAQHTGSEATGHDNLDLLVKE